MNLSNLKNKKVFGIKLPIILLGLLIVTVVALIIRHKIKKNKYLVAECEKLNGTWNKKEKKCITKSSSGNSVNGDESGNENGTSVPTWNPSSLATEIAKNLEGYNFMVYPETADKILALNDQQLRILYDYYNKNNAVDYPSLTQLFENEWDDTLWGYSKYDMVVDRLKNIGLN